MKLILMIAICITCVYARKHYDIELPEYAVPCKLNSPDRDECIKNSIQQMLPRMHQGIPSMNIPPADPYTVNSTLYEFKNGAIRGSLNIKSAKLFGVTRAQIKDVRTKIDDNGMTGEFDTYFPRIFIEGTYKGEGRLNNFKVNAKGYFNISMSDITSTHRMTGKFVYHNNKKYLDVVDIDMDVLVDDMKFYATGLFPDNDLNILANQFINQYWPVLYREMIPESKRLWAPLAIKEVNRFLTHIPFHNMLTL